MGSFMEAVQKLAQAKRIARRRSFLKGIAIRAPRPKGWVSRPKKYVVGEKKLN